MVKRRAKLKGREWTFLVSSGFLLLSLGFAGLGDGLLGLLNWLGVKTQVWFSELLVAALFLPLGYIILDRATKHM